MATNYVRDVGISMVFVFAVALWGLATTDYPPSAWVWPWGVVAALTVFVCSLVVSYYG